MTFSRCSRVLMGLGAVSLCCSAALAAAPFDPNAAPRAPQRIALSVEPARFLLGTHEDATITLDLGTAGKRVTQVQLVTNAGSVEDLRAGPDGKLLATYRPPAQLFPQVAILAATAEIDGTPCVGWTALRLYGQGVLPVSGRPGAELSVQIGDDSFGPVTADGNGDAEVRVEVPPGYATGTSGRKSIPLGAVPFIRLLALPMRSILVADGAAETEIYVFAVNARGEPLEDADIDLDVDSGQVGTIQGLDAGVFAARVRPPAGATGSLQIVASFEGAEEYKSSAAIEMAPSYPSSVELVVNPQQLQAGSDQAALTAGLLDGEGNAVSGVVVFETDLGTLSAVETLGSGTYEVKLSAPGQLPSAGALNVKARASGASGALQATATVPVVAGAPQKIAVKAGATELRASGTSSVDVEVTVADRYGNPVEGADLAADANVGKLSEVEEVGGGVYRARYTAPLAYDSQVATLNVRASDDVNGVVNLKLSPQKKIFLIGAHLGFESNFSALNAPLGAIDFTLRGWDWFEGVLLQLELGGLYAFGEARPESGPLQGQTIPRSMFVVPVSVLAGYQLSLMDDLSLIAGAGGGGGYVLSSVADSSSHLLTWAAMGQLGVTYTLGPGELVVKGRYTYGGVEGGFGGVSLMGGYAFEIF